VKRIPKTATFNDSIKDMRVIDKSRMEILERFDMDGPLPLCIVRNGGQRKNRTKLKRNWNPTESRDFNVREFASFQGFPHNFEFPDAHLGNIIGMIGDSVPPKYSKPFYAEIMKTLIDTDDGVESVSRSPFDYPILSSTC
jgi:site-specific DNA-cytosine methylase